MQSSSVLEVVENSKIAANLDILLPIVFVFQHMDLLKPKSRSEGETSAAGCQVSACHKSVEIDSALAELGRDGPSHITELQLSELNITDTGLLNISKNVPLLKTLYISSTRITDASMRVIAKRCSLLKDVDISKCHFLTNTSLMALVAHCRQISRLIITDCVNFTDSSLIHLRRLADLAHLEMDHLHQATDASLIHIIRFCNLKYLSVQGCPLIGDQS